jgi:hypothetical protein
VYTTDCTRVLLRRREEEERVAAANIVVKVRYTVDQNVNIQKILCCNRSERKNLNGGYFIFYVIFRRQKRGRPNRIESRVMRHRYFDIHSTFLLTKLIITYRPSISHARINRLYFRRRCKFSADANSCLSRAINESGRAFSHRSISDSSKSHSQGTNAGR